MADIAKETLPVFNHGVKTVTNTPTPLTTLTFNALKGVLLRCPGVGETDANTKPIWVGATPNFEVGSIEDSSGFPIYPGHSLIFPIDKPLKLYVRVATLDADQIVYWLSI